MTARDAGREAATPAEDHRFIEFWALINEHLRADGRTLTRGRAWAVWTHACAISGMESVGIGDGDSRPVSVRTDLIAALRGLLAVMEACEGKLLDDRFYQGAKTAARAALAKAEGRQP